MSKALLKAGCSIAALILTAGTAFAQDAPQENQSVRDRAAAAVAQGGFGIGSFVAFPRLEASATSTDNVFASEFDEVDDTLYVVATNLRIQSQWSRHALGLTTGFISRSYADNDSENTEDFNVAVDGRLDLGSRTTINAAVFAANESEPRFAGLATNQVAEPIEFSRTRANAAIAHTLNRVRLQASYVQESYDYDDSVTIVDDGMGGTERQPFEQDDRDFTADDLEGRLDVALSPDTGLFASVAYRTRDFDQDDVLDRDSEGTRALIGATFDILRLARGEIAGGYSTTSFDGAQFQDVDAFTASGQIEWFPTQLTTVTLDLVRDTFASGIGEESSVERLRYGARVDHELLRNVIVSAAYTREEDDYAGIDRNDERNTLFASVEYELNRSVAVALTAERREQESLGVDRERTFEANRYGLALILRR